MPHCTEASATWCPIHAGAVTMNRFGLRLRLLDCDVRILVHSLERGQRTVRILREALARMTVTIESGRSQRVGDPQSSGETVLANLRAQLTVETYRRVPQ